MTDIFCFFWHNKTGNCRTAGSGVLYFGILGIFNYYRQFFCRVHRGRQVLFWTIDKRSYKSVLHFSVEGRGGAWQSQPLHFWLCRKIESFGRKSLSTVWRRPWIQNILPYFHLSGQMRRTAWRSHAAVSRLFFPIFVQISGATLSLTLSIRPKYRFCRFFDIEGAEKPWASQETPV